MRSIKILMVGGLTFIGFSLALPSWAEETESVISPDQLEAAKAVERNTYHNEEYGFSITKPEGWTLHEPNGVRLGPTFYASTVEFLGGVALTQFPPGTQWVLANPQITVQVYKDTLRGSAELLITKLLRTLQERPDFAARVALPPTHLEVNGKTWVKAGAFCKDPTKQNVETYTEYCVHTMGDKIFLAEFSARSIDVPSIRKEVDSAIQSITLDESSPVASDTKTAL